MTIVCATHFTASSSDAVIVAAQLSRRTKQRLWLVTVLPGVRFSTTPPSDREQAVHDALNQEARVLREQGLEVEVAVLHGRVERVLGTLCSEVDARLLVVGDSHHKPALFATPVDRIASGVSVPMLVVRSMRPFEAWSRGEQPLKVMLAIDHTWSSALARDWLIGLAEYGPLDVVATHLWSPAEEHARRRGDQTPRTEASDRALAEELTWEAEAAFRTLPAHIRMRVMLELGDGHLGDLLLRLAAREQVDMLVLGTHPQEKGLLARLTAPSTSHEVLSHGLMSVALVPGELSAQETLRRGTPTSPRTMKERARHGP